MTDLELIRQAIKKKPEETKKLKVRITKKALEKIHAYAKAVHDVMGELEVYGYLVCPRGQKEPIATDFYLPNQTVGGTYCRVAPREVIKTGKMLKKKGFKILGWSHSHSNFSCFHSPTDNENMKIILNEIASDNYTMVPYKNKLIKGDMESEADGKKLVIKDTENDVVVEIDLDSRVKGKVKDASILSPIKVGFAYSVVVNVKGENYCEVATKEFCPMYYRPTKSTSEKTELDVVDGGDAAYNLKAIKAEIKSKVKERSFWDFDSAAYDVDDGEEIHLTKTELDEFIKQREEEIRMQYDSKVREFFRMHPVLKYLLKAWDKFWYPPEYRKRFLENDKGKKEM